MNLALLYGDLQAESGAERLRADPAMPLQQWRVRRFYADLLKLFKDHKCKYLIDLGDTTDNRESIRLPILSEVSAGLWAINPDPLCSFKLIGNHEQLYKHGGVSSASVYWKHHYVTTDTCVVDLGVDKPVVVLASFPANEASLAGWLDETCDRLAGRKTLLLGHFQVNGARMSKGTSETGITTGTLGRFTLALLGHVHRPQQIGSLNAHYVGSPFQQDYGEAGEHKRVGLLDLDTLALTWLELPSRYPTYRELTVDEFLRTDDLAEDQVTVALRDAREAETFYADPRSSLVRPSLLHFSASGHNPAKSGHNQANFDATALIASYVDEHPLGGFTAEELAQEGAALLQ